MIIDSGCRVRLARFCRAEIRAGCCPGFRASGLIFVCSWSRVLSVAILEVQSVAVNRWQHCGSTTEDKNHSTPLGMCFHIGVRTEICVRA